MEDVRYVYHLFSEDDFLMVKKIAFNSLLSFK
ncbi:hypothetical protein BH10BAC1_BH10BAC1_15040 [soil metagenome]